MAASDLVGGVKIHHPTERSCVYVLMNPKRPYPTPYVCGWCMTTHLFKAYHIIIDSFGNAIIAKGIVDKLKMIPGQPFQFENEVAKPPPMIIGGSRKEQPIIQSPENSNG
jgi:hypothetical protein